MPSPTPSNHLSQKRSFGHGESAAPDRMLRKDFVDTFGRIFPRKGRPKGSTLNPSAENADRLERLGFEMAQKGLGSGTRDSQIPAGYTYWGQFIDHDITFDPTSSLSSDNQPARVQNFRTPRLDLDCVYGAGPATDPHLYDQDPPGAPDTGAALLLGSNQPTGRGGPASANRPTDFDVPRNSQQTALLGDPRNDENLIVSQLHHAFLKYHNAVVQRLLKQGISDPFAEARRLVRQHHQFAVRHDFLPTICQSAIVKSVFDNGPQFFTQSRLRMPVEFAVAAYRFGHSMIRDDYSVNDNFPAASMDEVFRFVRRPLIPVFSNWVVDFNRFFPTGSDKPLNMARAINTELANQLNALPGQPPGLMSRLAARNLVRGLRFRLPSGQAVASMMGITPLSRAELLQGASAAEAAILQEKRDRLLTKTPLWYYVLKEAEVKAGGERLGEIGSTIVSEVFFRMIRDDADSYLNLPGGFTPSLPRRDRTAYTIVDILRFAEVL